METTLTVVIFLPIVVMTYVIAIVMVKELLEV